MEEVLKSLDPRETIYTALIFVIGIVILTKIGADQLAQELVEIYGLFLAVGTVVSLILIAQLYRKAVGSEGKTMV